MSQASQPARQFQTAGTLKEDGLKHAVKIGKKEEKNTKKNTKTPKNTRLGQSRPTDDDLKAGRNGQSLITKPPPPATAHIPATAPPDSTPVLPKPQVYSSPGADDEMKSTLSNLLW